MKKLIYGLFISAILVFTAGASQQTSVDTGYVDVPDGKLYYEEAGKGDETIVLIHDGLVHGEIWDHQFLTFAEKYRVIRYDRRGYGRSPKPEKKYSNIDDLNAVFNFFNIDKAILIGMSAGGGLVLDFAIHYPEKTSALILVGAVVGGFSYSDHFMTRGGRLQTSDYANRDKLLQYLLTEDPYEIAPQNKEVKEKLRTLMQAYPQNMDFEKNRLATIPERKAINELKNIQAPVLLIIGEFDIPDVFVHAGAIESGVPYARKVIIQNAGHLVPFEQPEIFNTQVLNYLIGAEFFQVLNTQGVADAVDMFNRTRNLEKNWIPFSEAQMNILGYQKLRSGKTSEAIE